MSNTLLTLFDTDRYHEHYRMGFWRDDTVYALVRAHAAFNILFGLTANDVVFWRRMGWKRYTKKNIETTIAMTVDTFLAALAA